MNIDLYRKYYDYYVYPGQPLVIACYILEKYSSLDEANKLGDRYPNALEDSDIPGAGGNIYGAIDLLYKIKGTPLEDVKDLALMYSNDYWKSCDSMFSYNIEKCIYGIEKSTKLIDTFYELYKKWRT
jgi:hypothetical protein